MKYYFDLFIWREHKIPPLFCLLLTPRIESSIHLHTKDLQVWQILRLLLFIHCCLYQSSDKCYTWFVLHIIIGLYCLGCYNTFWVMDTLATAVRCGTPRRCRWDHGSSCPLAPVHYETWPSEDVAPRRIHADDRNSQHPLTLRYWLSWHLSLVDSSIIIYCPSLGELSFGPRVDLFYIAYNDVNYCT